MQKAILGYGKTAAGKYRPLLVDDQGHLVIEVDAVAASQQPALYASGSAGEFDIEQSKWIDQIFCWNGGTVGSTVTVGSTKGGANVVNATVVEPGEGELLPLAKRFAKAIHWSATHPVALSVYTRAFRK